MTMPVGVPIAPPGVGAGAPASAAASGGGAGGLAAATPGAEGFGALVAAALAVVPGTAGPAETVTPVAAGTTATGETGDADATGDDEQSSEPAADEKAAQLLGVVVPVALLTVVPAGAAPPAADASPSPALGEADTAAVDAGPTVSSQPIADDFLVPTATPSDTGLSSGAQQDGEPFPATQQVDQQVDQPVDQPVDPSAPSVLQAVAPLDGARGVDAASGPDATAATGPVARQTFPEVTRLMSRGDGTHRVTLQLRPEGLGEVRVVLTLRGGKVDVRMTASSEARHALTTDLPELHRLLAMSGATETSVSVRDGQQLVASSWDGNRSTAGSSYDLMGQAGGGTGQPGHQESPQQARTPADHIATDGARDRANASGPNDPATGARTAGLDVTV